MSFFKTIEEAIGATPDEIKRIRVALPTSPIKRLLEYDIEMEIFNRTQGDAAKTLEDLHYQRGIREGLKIAKGILNRPPK